MNASGMAEEKKFQHWEGGGGVREDQTEKTHIHCPSVPRHKRDLF